MPRSLWKGPFVDRGVKKLWERVAMKFGSTGQKDAIKVYSRRSTIIPDFAGYKFEIYNGRDFVPLKINTDMIGHKFGEFAMTRVYPQHPEKVLPKNPTAKQLGKK